MHLHLRELSDEELMTRAAAVCRTEDWLVAEVVAYLIEVEDRRLDLRLACTSLFDFCVRHLKMSEGAAYRRINAARLVRRFPCLLARIANGDIHVSGLVILRDHLTDANAEELSEAASGLSETKLRALLAARAPRPPVPGTVRPLSPAPDQSGLPHVAPSPVFEPQRGRPRIEPLSSTTFLVQFTMSGETHAKLQRARDLLRHGLPDGDISSIVDRALDLLVAKAERDRRATTKRPSSRSEVGKAAAEIRTRGSEGSPRAADTKITRATRRETFARDGEQCTFRNEAGERCQARSFLELDHVEARARGGSSELSNLRVLCRSHNRLHAEEDFGRAHVEQEVQRRRRGSQDGNVPSAAPVVVPNEEPEEHFRQRKSSEVAVPKALQVGMPSEEARAVHGLVDLGFRRTASARTVRSILMRRGARAPLGDVLREAIGVLAALDKGGISAPSG